MQLIETPLKECYIIRNTIFKDDRGYFFESFNHRKFSQLTGWEGSFVQDNQSESVYGVVRGLHFQLADYAQAKLVRVVKGKVLDVAVDLRPDSPSFGKSFSIELSDENEYQLLYPVGLRMVFGDQSNGDFFYKCDNYYNKASEGGINPYDKDLAIDWQIPPGEAILSEKDMKSPSWEEYISQL